MREARQSLDEDLPQVHTSNQNLREGLKAIGSQSKHITTLEGLITFLQERIKTLEGQQAKESYKRNKN